MANFVMNMKPMIAKTLNELKRLDDALLIFGKQGALKLQNAARQNKTWTNRTGDAWRGLTGEAWRIAQGVRMALMHTVWYGIYLEKAHQEKYAIIDKTIRYVGAFEIMPAFERWMERL